MNEERESFDSLTYISYLLEELATVPNVTATTEGKAGASEKALGKKT